MATTTPDLTGFKALSFDCYGTLVDWETGMVADLQPLLSLLPPTHAWAQTPLLAVRRFDALATAREHAHPTQSYREILREAYLELADELAASTAASDTATATATATAIKETKKTEIEQAAAHMGSGPGRWAAFPDTLDGLRRLKRHYKLIILSNVDDENIRGATAGALGAVPFDAVYTAQQIGSYKPTAANFRHLFAHACDELGVAVDAEAAGTGELLHVAASLWADHVPAKQFGLRSVWITRGGDRQAEGSVTTGADWEGMVARGEVGFEWKFQTIGEFADEVDRQFASK